MPLLIEKEPKYPNNIKLDKKNLLLAYIFKVYEIVHFINSIYLHLYTSMDGKFLNIMLTVT